MTGIDLFVLAALVGAMSKKRRDDQTPTEVPTQPRLPRPPSGQRLPTSGAGAFGAHRETHSHNGIDLAAPRGRAVYAPADGIVMHAVSTWRQGFSGYGRSVVLRHSDGRYTLYAHLDSVTVDKGQRVPVGTVIGTVGNSTFTKDNPTKESGGTHLHFEVSPTPYPQPNTTPRINPVTWLGDKGKIL